MLDLSNERAEICVIGRTTFTSGIGAITYSACELLARSYPVSLLPTDRRRDDLAPVLLPNGRPIPICTDIGSIRLFFFADILWNGAHDLNYTLIPDYGLRVAHIAFDSDELPDRWVQILNERFDLALFTSHHLESVAVRSGVAINIGTLPIALDIAPILARPQPRPAAETVRFGALAAWHERKGASTLVDAFVAEFGNERGVELVLHSNLRMDDTYDVTASRVDLRNCPNISLSHSQLSIEEKDSLLDSLDVLVNCSRGEGYAITPREALARGRPLVLSDIGAHRDLLGLPGVFGVTMRGHIPARYPEIDDLIFGRQLTFELADLRRALREAYEYATGARDDHAIRLRKQRAAEFSFGALASSYEAVVSPQLRQFRKHLPPSQFARVPDLTAHPRSLGMHARSLRVRDWLVVPAHDGGFFSVFNAFMSHLVWELREERCHLVIPDWNIVRLQRSRGALPLESFCYGRPEDGNIWCHLFEPPFGLSVADMNDSELLERKATTQAGWNEHREPLLTYYHAYYLYRSPYFPNLRRQYNRVLKQHIQLLPHLAAEIDAFSTQMHRKFIIAAHVKHPSHVIEQPGATMASTRDYLQRISMEVERRGFTGSSRDWGVFLATDQDSVVLEFERHFGERLEFFRDVRRTSLAEDAQFMKLPPAKQRRIGHQVQHTVAATPDNWSVSMAWQVIRDALAMSRCDILFHAVSNVATAASYLNPDLQMIFCEPSSP